MAATSPGKVRTLRVSHTAWEAPLTRPAMSNAVDRHERYRLTNRYVEVAGVPCIPVSGEIHFSRLPRGRWEDRLRLMKAGGITVAACYVFWLHHEPQEGDVRFDGNLDVAAFVRLCRSVGLDVVLRIGPWCHGEVRNGGFPDWVQAADVRHRTNDPSYLRLVQRWFGRLGAELAELVGPDSNVIGIQLENELYDQPGHLRELKNLARAAGLNAPVWTATAWGGADLPHDEVLPLFGGYGDGFWVDADAPWDVTFREHYLFSHVWDDPGIGADLREHLGNGDGAAPPRTPSALYPAATCELAGGMATAYQRRPWPRALDVAAVAHNKIGNGSAWQGYYMFAGGTNPADDMQESQATGYPNDLPRFDYDFHAPIGAAGRLSASFAQLRKQHAFLAAFGQRLARMPSSLPEVRPDGVDDSTTLRWALRSDGQSGFVFITWHQPHVPLDAYPAAQFEVDLDAGTVAFPDSPLSIPPGTIAHWPVNLEVGGVLLEWATASPLTILGHGSAPTLVLAAEPGIGVELRLKEGTALAGPATALADNTYAVAADAPVLLTATAGDSSLNILVLPDGAADTAWVLDTEHGRQLVLSREPVWVAASGNLAGRTSGAPEVLRYSLESASFEAVVIAGARPSQELELPEAELIRPARPVPPSFGSVAGRASAPSPAAIAELARMYRIGLPAGAFPGSEQAGGSTGGGTAELEIHWAGDVAQLLVDGIVVADRFWDGSPWIVELSDAGIGAQSDVVLHILPLATDAAVGLPLEARRRRDSTTGDLVSLDSLRVVRWTEWTEKPGP
ncbi:beta-galactosidase [Arthrobacter oryzae]|uniref:beta-galactosidase n=1 Tax=Arthrobacter oryzae TaxID=409290 RepID=UPI0030C9F110